MTFTVTAPLTVYPIFKSPGGMKRATFFTNDRTLSVGSIVELDDELVFFMKSVVFFTIDGRYYTPRASVRPQDAPGKPTDDSRWRGHG